MRPTDHDRGICATTEAPCKQCDNGNGPVVGLVGPDRGVGGDDVDVLVFGADCALGGPILDNFVEAERCPCGCALEWQDDGFGWLCSHCDGVPW